MLDQFVTSRQYVHVLPEVYRERKQFQEQGTRHRWQFQVFQVASTVVFGRHVLSVVEVQPELDQYVSEAVRRLLLLHDRHAEIRAVQLARHLHQLSCNNT